MCWSVLLIDTWSTSLNRPLIDIQSTSQLACVTGVEGEGKGKNRGRFDPFPPFLRPAMQATSQLAVCQESTNFGSSVDWVPTEYQLGCCSSVDQDFDWVSITGRLGVLIDTQPHMHLVNMIFLSVYSVNSLALEKAKNHFEFLNNAFSMFCSLYY